MKRRQVKIDKAIKKAKVIQLYKQFSPMQLRMYKTNMLNKSYIIDTIKEINTQNIFPYPVKQKEFCKTIMKSNEINRFLDKVARIKNTKVRRSFIVKEYYPTLRNFRTIMLLENALFLNKLKVSDVRRFGGCIIDEHAVLGWKEGEAEEHIKRIKELIEQKFIITNN